MHVYCIMYMLRCVTCTLYRMSECVLCMCLCFGKLGCFKWVVPLRRRMLLSVSFDCTYYYSYVRFGRNFLGYYIFTLLSFVIVQISIFNSIISNTEYYTRKCFSRFHFSSLFICLFDLIEPLHRNPIFNCLAAMSARKWL